jgi:hypothetical protein
MTIARARWSTILLATLSTALVAQGTPPAGGTGGRGGGAQPATPAMTSSPLPTGRVTYRTLTEANLEMERIEAAYPTKVKRFALPHKTSLGSTVWALEITHDVKTPSGKPVFVMTGLHHSREWPTVELPLEFIHDLLKNDGTDPRITAALEKVRFIAVPIVNPDGFDLSRTLINEQKRKNCRVQDGKEPTYAECANPLNAGAGVDLNRNYGAFRGGIGANAAPNGQSYRGAAPFSEPEIQNMRDLFASHQVVVALSNHTPDAKVLRVPSTTDEPTPFDVAQYDSVAQLLGKDLKWDAGPWPKVYYNASGTMEEQAYYTAGTFAFTFENTPGQRGFHPAYSFVVDQYFGTGAYPGSSSRAGYMRLLEAAADPALHSVLEIKAPAGATLTLSKKIVLESAPVLLSDRDSTRGPIVKQPMELTSTTVVPKGNGPFLWHVNPSSRPSQHGQELIAEQWTVSCKLKGKPISVAVTVARGAKAKVDLGKCQ